MTGSTRSAVHTAALRRALVVCSAALLAVGTALPAEGQVARDTTRRGGGQGGRQGGGRGGHRGPLSAQKWPSCCR